MNKTKLPAIFAGIGFMILILDTKTALVGALEGLQLCLQVLIPSLFPFMFLSIILTSALSTGKIRYLSVLARILQIPENALHIVPIGLVGGYPVGAWAVSYSVHQGHISRETGKRMLAFCSNAGPAFIFGIGSRLFPHAKWCWALWLIHILSALLTGYLIPANNIDPSPEVTLREHGASNPLEKAIKNMALVCGWVILFRIVMTYLQHWFLWLLPVCWQVVLAGILELSNGCYGLVQIEDLSIRFILCTAFLSLGGVCVAFQTFSITKGMDNSWYFPGKLLQTALSVLMGCMLISQGMRLPLALFLIIFCIAYKIFPAKRQKGIAIRAALLYNRERMSGGNLHVVSEKD